MGRRENCVLGKIINEEMKKMGFGNKMSSGQNYHDFGVWRFRLILLLGIKKCL